MMLESLQNIAYSNIWTVMNETYTPVFLFKTSLAVLKCLDPYSRFQINARKHMYDNEQKHLHYIATSY